MADIFKDKEVIDAMDDVYRALSCARIASIDRDPNAFVKLSERMGALNSILIRKLVVRSSLCQESLQSQTLMENTGELKCLKATS